MFLEVRVISRHHLARLKIRLAIGETILSVDGAMELAVAATF